MSVIDHVYLNKWDGDYICMDWSYKLSPTDDVTRIANELDLEALTPCDSSSIPLGLSVGELSQRRGVTIAYLRSFTQEYSCWDWNTWMVIRKIIKPRTVTTRCRYVEIYDVAPLVGPANTFISYAQQGRWGDLVAACWMALKTLNDTYG